MELESQPLESVISASGVTIVDFYAPWCGPCKMMKPILDAIDASGKATVIKVDTVTHEDVATKYGVKSLPTICFFRDGVFQPEQTKVGATPKPTLEKIIAEL